MPSSNTYPDSFFAMLPAAVESAYNAGVGHNFFSRSIANNFSPEVSKEGAGVTFAVANSSYTVSNVTDQPLNVSQVSATDVSVTLDDHPAVWFPLPDYDTVRTPVDLRKLYLDEALKKVAKYINKKTTGLITATKLNANTAIAGTDAGTITDAQMQAAWTKLAEKDVDMTSGDLFLAVTPAVYASLLNRPSWSQAAYLGDNKASGIRSSALLGRQWGATCDYDAEIPLSSGSKPQAVLYHKAAFGFAARALPKPKFGGVYSQIVNYGGIPLRFTIDYNQGRLAEMVTVDALIGYDVIDPNAAIIILSA